MFSARFLNQSLLLLLRPARKRANAHARLRCMVAAAVYSVKQLNIHS
jgi:hypothetical protein